MMSTKYDVITIGGGLAGSALARSLAERGRRVLVLEATTEFKDRIRGEQVCSWGVAEAMDLGIYDLLLTRCGQELPWWDIYIGQSRVEHRDLCATTPQQLPSLAYYHPRMQQILIEAAEMAGAEVRRGARVTGVEPGSPARVTVQYDTGSETIECALVAACDGRNSPSRKWGDFEVCHEPDRMQISGLFFHGITAEDDTNRFALAPMLNRATVIFPQGGGDARSYLVGWKTSNRRYQGEDDIPAYIDAVAEAGMPPELFEKATADGPLATFDGADSYVNHPYKDGIALVGDAAASSDPCWGQGQPLTLRDVRELRDQILATGDTDSAGHNYAEAHDRYYGVVRRTEDWFTTLIFEPGAEADARRGRALGGGALNMPEVDTFQAGPDAPQIRLDEDVRQRFFGEVAPV
jgi:2-polyprenyl-6-methoxyphenol hydroxylase-like FAD-dependent oxidoreductase